MPNDLKNYSLFGSPTSIVKNSLPIYFYAFNFGNIFFWLIAQRNFYDARLYNFNPLHRSTKANCYTIDSYMFVMELDSGVDCDPFVYSVHSFLFFIQVQCALHFRFPAFLYIIVDLTYLLSTIYFVLKLRK